MATPLPDFEAARGGGGGVASSSTTVLTSSVPSSAASTFTEDAEEISPILIFLFFHKAVCSELESLHRLALEFATGHHVDLRLLRERYRFLRSIYKHHCNAEDEVIFSALDIRVKNVAQTYSLEHQGEGTLFDHLFELLNSATEIDESYRRELASSTGALKTSVSQHLAKEQKQVFPLLIEKFKHEEQAYIVWRFLCSIPVNMLAVFLPWLASSISIDESKEMQMCLSKIVPGEKLLQQVIFTWLGGKSDTAASRGVEDSSFQCCLDSSSSMLPCKTSRAQCACEGSKAGKRKYPELTEYEAPDAPMHPIDEIKIWHKSINKEMKDIADEARKIQLSGDFSDLSAFDERLQYIAEVCIFHSLAEDKIIFPAVDGEFSFSEEHDEEENQFNEFRCLIEKIKSAGASSTSAAEFYTKLCSHADQIMETIQRHFHNEEIQVLPLARKNFSFKRQQEILYQSLCIMPLRLIERVLPWLTASLTEDEAKNFLKNLQAGAPKSDAALVTLFSGWACKGRKAGECLSPKANGSCPAKTLSNIEEVYLQSCNACVSLPCPSRSIKACCQHQDKRPAKRTVVSSCGQNATPHSSEVANGNGRSCCVPDLGVNSDCLGLGSLPAAKSMRSSSLNSAAPALNSSLFGWEMDSNSFDTGHAERPVATIFKFHKAISKDLEFLDVESGKLIDCDETFIRQFIGRFHLLWGFYKAHSNAEDDILFPALESKETLHNVSHSYTLDHKHEPLTLSLSLSLSPLLSIDINLVLHRSRRICSCSLGFPRDLRGADSKEDFLRGVRRVEDSLIDPWGSSKVVTVQVRAPKVRKDSIGDGAVDEAAAEEEASAQRKRVSLQRQAAVTVEAAEDYARRFESGVNELSSNEEELAQCGVNVMCRMCFLGESHGSERARRMLSCKTCGKKYHKNCVKSWAQHRDLFHWSSWSCPSCRVCEVCRRTGDPNKFVFCKRCDAAYHCYCQHPPHKNVSSGPYLCPKHTRCHSCDSTVPGNGLSVRWFLSYTCCDACGRLFVKGNYCPLCLKVYRDSESTPMVCCDLCQRWVHCHCDGISDEKYLQFQADGNLQYKCATCRGEGYQVKDLQDAVQELWKKKDMVDAELVASLRAAAGLPTDEEIFSISPFSDDEENGPVSGRSVKLSIKGLVDKSPKKSKEYRKHVSKKGHHTKSELQQDSDVHHGMESQRSRLSGAKTDSFGIQMNERSDVRSSVAGICSTHEPRIVKHKRVDDVMVTDEEKPSRIVRIKCSNKPQDSDSEETSLKAKKLVINLGARKINVSDSSKSNVVSHSRDRDQSSGEVRTLKISGRFGKTKSEGSKGTFGSITQFPASTSAGSHVDDKTSISPSLQKEARPLLKFKLRKPDSGDQTSLATTQSEDEKLSSGKGQRSKRKRPSSLVDKASLEEDGDSRQDSPRSDEMMDANWILKKLGKDSIGKRVEVQGSQNSWNKGTVTDVIRDTSTLSVSLDDGSMKTFELGKHNVRFIPQKQKRSRS